MRLPALAIVALLATASGGCASPERLAPLNVVVRGPATACPIQIDGRDVTHEELLTIARREVKARREAIISGDMSKVPYRCLGAAIYTLQVAGFKVGFISEPAAP
jgi:hypothetical protein